MSSYCMSMRNNFYKISLFVKFSDNRLSRLIAVHACIFAAVFIDCSVIVHDVDLRQVVALAYLEVVRVMSRRDLHRSCSELLIYIVIRHDRDLPSHKRQDHIFPYDILIALVIRMHSDGRISQHGLRTCGRDLEETVCSYDRIFNMPEVSLLILVFYLCIGKRGFTFRAPVDDPGSFIDVPFVVQADKHFLYSLGASLVHSETLSVPVTGDTQLLELVLDRTGILFFPLPYSLQEPFTAQFFLINTFVFQLVCHLYLCRDRRMVCSRDPQRIISFHSLVSDQDILKCIVKSVAHMKLSRNIRRRHHRRKRFSAAVHFRMEIFVLTPFLIQFFFDRFRIISLC